MELINENENDDMKKLISQINLSLKKTEEELTDKLTGVPKSDKIISSVKGIIDNLKKELTDGLNPERSLNVVVIGQTNAGKTCLIHALCREPVETIERSEECQWYKVNENMNLLDTCGFQNNKKKEIIKKLNIALKEKVPDLVFAVFNASVLRTWKDYSKDFNECIELVLKECKSAKSTLPSFKTTQSVPIIWVITHMDQCSDELQTFQWTRDLSFPEWKQHLENNQDTILKIIKDKLQIFKYFQDTDLLCTTAVPSNQKRELDYGIDTLLNELLTSLPLNIQIQANSKKRYEAKRRAIAMKIISSYSALCAVVSLLPLVDIPLSMWINHSMLVTLEALRTDPLKTAQSFEAANSVTLAATYGVRGILFGTFFLLDLTGVGMAVSLPAGAAVAASTTTALGVKVYNYFTE